METTAASQTPVAHRTLTLDELLAYSKIIVAFSGGKDSLACLLALLEAGVPKDRIELWHHDIDGREGPRLMDWACTPDYCRQVAAALGVPLYVSWRVGGFEREMCRSNTPTAPTRFECPDGVTRQIGGQGPNGTRQKFPQVAADLKVRWCSAYLKIDVCAAALRNQERFNNTRTLVVSGERAEESPGRARYATFEPDRTDARAGRARRHVDRYRPVHQWSTAQVWDIIRRWRINPHPAYRLGWGRVSCAACIFGSADQFASLRAVNPAQFARVAAYEQQFGATIKRNVSLPVLVEGQPAQGRRKAQPAGKVYDMKPADIAAALSETFAEPAIIPEGTEWQLPAGAFGESCGPV